MTILYINYVDDACLSSGSSVRPAKMLKAFQDLGYKLLLLTGEQFAKSRTKSVTEILKKIREVKPDLCYIESPTYPVVRHADRHLIKVLHDQNVPIGYFYRDFYRKFPNQFPRKKGLIGAIKDVGLDILQYLTDRVLKKCDIVYFPTIEASNLFKYDDMRALPPAGENHIGKPKKLNHTGIYVGGIIGHYDAALLLDTFSMLYCQDSSYKLILVCREEEWKSFSHPCKEANWLEVHHVSGKELEPLYNRASIAFVMPNMQYAYSQLGLSVKIFEYISYGLPIVALNSKPIVTLFKKEKIGISVSPDPLSVYSAVMQILADDDSYQIWQKNVSTALLKNNLWTHRVQQVISELMNKK